MAINLHTGEFLFKQGYVLRNWAAIIYCLRFRCEFMTNMH